MSFPGQPDYHSDVQRTAFRKQAQHNQRARSEQWNRTQTQLSDPKRAPWADALQEDPRAFPECASKGPQKAGAAGLPTPLDIRGAERIGGTVDFGLGPSPTEPRDRPVGGQRLQVAGLGSLVTAVLDGSTPGGERSLRITQSGRQFGPFPADGSQIDITTRCTNSSGGGDTGAGGDGAPAATPWESALESARIRPYGQEKPLARKHRDLLSNTRSMGFAFPAFDRAACAEGLSLPLVTESALKPLPAMRHTFNLSHDTFRSQYRSSGGPFAAEFAAH